MARGKFQRSRVYLFCDRVGKHNFTPTSCFAETGPSRTDKVLRRALQFQGNCVIVKDRVAVWTEILRDSFFVNRGNRVMKREMILFCRVAWMKYYQGVTDDDQPERGGAYVDAHRNAHESDNFRPYNHVCRGHFPYSGAKMNLERISGEKKAPDQLDGVTVVWVATAPDGNQYIAGWYKNASVYRYIRASLEATRHDGEVQYYWMTAKETDCTLIPEANRDFEIPNATRIGAGKGMGQSIVSANKS